MGQVQIGPGSKVINCTIRGPVIIGSDCHLENCFIGPYSSLADQVTLVDVDLEHSVVLQGANFVGIHQRIVESLIGQRAHIKTAPKRPKSLSLFIGDDCQLELESGNFHEPAWMVL